MSIQIQANAPQVTVAGRTLAVGAYLANKGMVGMFYQIGIYELDASGQWREVILAENTGSLLDGIQRKGGRVKYIAWLIKWINDWFAKAFAAVPVTPTGEPQTDAEALAAVVEDLGAMKFTVVDGVPVLGGH